MLHAVSFCLSPIYPKISPLSRPHDRYLSTVAVTTLTLNTPNTKHRKWASSMQPSPHHSLSNSCTHFYPPPHSRYMQSIPNRGHQESFIEQYSVICPNDGIFFVCNNAARLLLPFWGPYYYAETFSECLSLFPHSKQPSFRIAQNKWPNHNWPLTRTHATAFEPALTATSTLNLPSQIHYESHFLLRVWLLLF